MWQLTRVGVLRWVLARNYTVCSKRSEFDLLIEISVDWHSLDGIRQINNKETEALICNQYVRGSSPCGGTI